MRSLYLAVFLFVATTALLAQSYTISQLSNQAIPEFDPNAVPTSSSDFIFGGTSSYDVNDQLSAAVNIGFTFSYYGQNVTSYKASDNGYITFNTSATNSVPTNLGAADPAEPNNAIYAWWTDLRVRNTSSQNGTADDVSFAILGTAPNRIHVVQWYSASLNPGGVAQNGGFVYAAVMLFEQGGFAVLHWNAGNPGGGAYTGTASVGAENADGSAGVFTSGSPTETYTSVTTDGTYNVFLFTDPANLVTDARLDLLSVGNPRVGSSVSITGKARNSGSTTVNNYTVKVSKNGAAAQSFPQTATLAGFFGTDDFSISYPAPTVADGSIDEYKVWIEATSDANPANDTLAQDRRSTLGNNAGRRPIIEEYSTAPCGYCPDGLVKLQSIEALNPNTVIVQHHAGFGTDAMTQSFHEAYANRYIPGAPMATVDRVYNESQGGVGVSRNVWASMNNSQKNVLAPMELSIDYNWDTLTNILDGTVTVEFLDYPYQVLPVHLTLWITVDSVSGTGNGWNQTNYYSYEGGAAGGASHPYYNYDDPIVGYQHYYVSVAAPFGTWGDNSTIPLNPTLNTPYVVPFSVAKSSLPSYVQSLDPNTFNVVAMASYYSANNDRELEALNAEAVSVDVTSSRLNSLQANSRLFPNPTQGQAQLQLALPQSGQLRVELLNSLGQVVAVAFEGRAAAGAFSTSLPSAGLPSGVYRVVSRGDAGQAVHSLVVE